MRLSSKTLEATAEIITGNSQLSPYQKLWQITTFFRNFGERDIHPNSGAPSRFSYAFEKLEKFNDTDTIAKIICASLQFWEANPALDPERRPRISTSIWFRTAIGSNSNSPRHT